MAKAKKKDSLGVGGIIGLVLAALLLLGILGGVVYYVHSGGAGIGESAGILAADENTSISMRLEEEKKAAAKEAEENGKVKKTPTESAKEAGKTASAESKDAKEADDAETASGEVAYKAKTTAKSLGAMYDADTDAFRKAYDGKTVTVTGKLSDKSSKMLYVELATGTKVPLRVYLSSEEQRELFNSFEKGRTLTVKGNVAVLYPQAPDSGGFQEMANGLIALDSVTLVK